MFNKIKMYFLLIPTLCVMLFNCVSFGQVLAADNIIDYSVFFVEPPQDVIDCMDFTDVENIDLFDFPDYSSFYYQVTCSAQAYENYNNHIIDYLPIDFLIVDFADSDTFVTIDPTTFSTTTLSYHYFTYYFYRDSGFEYDYHSNSSRYFYFQPLVGRWAFNTSPWTPDEWDLGYPNHLTLYIECDYFDLNSSSSSSLNVDVVFNPHLSGEVDRSVTLDDGSTALKNSITMAIYNHSNFDVQYQMHIYRKGDYPEIGGVSPDVYPVFTYYKKDWVYAHGLGSNADWWNKVEKQYKATDCHLVLSGRTDVVTFDFNQLPLSEGVEYTVIVSAVRNDYKFASEHYIADYEELYPDLFQLQGTQLVFHSDFSMKQYSDVKYDRNNTNNGVLPYQGKDDKQLYDNSYYAKEDSDGNIDYEGKDVYNDPSSWYNNELNHDFDPSGKWYDGLVGDKESGGSSDGTFTSFASSFTNYFQFLAYIFNYFPVGIKNAFLVGFVGIMVVALVKVIFK